MRNVTPLPAIGEVFTGQDTAGRTLRVSCHPEAGRTVLSVWQEGRCLATVRIAAADVPELTRVLVAGLVQQPTPRGPGATVHRLGVAHAGTAPVTSPTSAPAAWRRAGTGLGDRVTRFARRLRMAVTDF